MKDLNVRCPWCGGGGSQSQVVRVAGREASEPKPSDPALCTECGSWSVWGDDEKLHKPDKAMAARIEESHEAFKLKLGWLLWRLNRRKKRPSPAEDVLIDIRNKVVDECRTKIGDGLQLIGTGHQALEIYMGVMMDQVLQSAIVFGATHQNKDGTDFDGEDCVAQILDRLATALASFEVGDLVDQRLEEYRAAKAEAEEGDA